MFKIQNEHTEETVENPVSHVLRTGTIVGLANHTVLVGRDGRRVPIDDSGAPIFDSEGKPRGVVLVYRDVSERKKAEERISQQANLLQGILNSSVDNIYIVDKQGRYRHVSKGGAKALGLQPRDMVGKHWKELGLPSESMNVFDKQREAVLATKEPYFHEMQFERPDGSTQEYEYYVSPIIDANGEADQVVVISRDVTDSNRLRDDVRLRANVLDNMSEGVSLSNEEGIILYTNPAEDRMFGYEPGELIGQHVSIQNNYSEIENRDRVATVIKELRESGSWTGVWSNRTKAGVAFTTRAKITALKLKDKLYWICVQEDITEQTRLQRDNQFLADASATLAALEDYKTTLTKVAQLAVPHFADWVTVDMLDGNGELCRLAVAHVDPAKVELARQIHEKYPPQRTTDQGVWKVLLSGVPDLHTEITDELLEQSIPDAELLATIKDLGLRSYMGLPLKLRDEVLGVITFIAAESGRRYRERDLVLAQDLVNRAGRSYRERKAVRRSARL